MSRRSPATTTRALAARCQTWKSAHIAKSFAKWSWARFTEEVLSELQRARANKR